MPDQLVFSGAELRRRRLALRITRTQLACAVDREAETIGFYELGHRRPTVAVLCALAAELGCTPNDLLEREQVAS